MITYNTLENGSITDGTRFIPTTHRFYAQALEEVEAGEAEILPYVEPEPTQAELNAPHLAYLAETDWYVIRQQETGAEIPLEILAARQAAREAII